MACPYWNLGLFYGHQNTTVLSEWLTFLSKDIPVPHVFLSELFCFIVSFWTPSSAGDIFLLYEPPFFFILAKVICWPSGCAPLPKCLCSSGLVPISSFFTSMGAMSLPHAVHPSAFAGYGQCLILERFQIVFKLKLEFIPRFLFNCEYKDTWV